MRLSLSITAIALIIVSCSSTTEDKMSPITVEIIRTDTGYQLMRGGEPYLIKGAGMGVNDIERFASHGGNSIRNWTTSGEYQDVMALLDSAQAHGVTVALCLPMQAERHDFDYDDADAVAKQLEAFRQDVIKFRDHPALLLWIIGNELNHSYTNPAVYDAVNDVAAMINALDPNHPTTTTLSGFKPDVIREIKIRAPELDFISFQMYGSLFGLPQQIAESEFSDPFMVTEWGTIGYWEMEKTPWGAPAELTSTEKADIFRRVYHEVLNPLEGQLIGSYVFLWGQKQERTHTWFGMLTGTSEETETVDVMHHIWDGSWPRNRTPQVQSITLDGKGHKEGAILVAGQDYEAEFHVTDHDGDPLTFRWEIKPESDAIVQGGDFEKPIESLDGPLAEPQAATTRLTGPAAGQYRLFAYAHDGQGHAAHANIPFLVEEQFKQSPNNLLAGEVMAVAYSGFREGQHPDRGNGAVNPSNEQILEDLELLVAHDFNLIRMYDSGENTEATMELIREHDLPIKVLLGIWLRAEFSNHLGCSWLDEPIPDDVLAANTRWNAEEIRRGIQLAREFSDVVLAVNVGNEALVDWNDHMVPVDKVIGYVREVKAAIEQPVTVADNYEWWKRDGAELAAEVDFLGVHTYPVWEDKSIDEALAYTVENIEGVYSALPGKSIVILEAGWATSATEFGERANQPDQARYFAEMKAWATKTNTTVIFFEAFDEPWKGDGNDPLGAEKHWGLFNVDRTPKLVFKGSSAVDGH
jgi:exo-beta-1,3-glucanase (GH17 family)